MSRERGSTDASPTTRLGRGVSDRDSYAEVGKAARESIEKALAAKATGRDLKVLLAIHHQLTTYSRLEDSIHADKLAAITGLRVDHVRESVARLIKAGTIRRRASKGRYPSVYGLPLANTPRGRDVSAEQQSGATETDPPRRRDVSGDSPHPGDGVRIHPADGTPTEKVSEKKSARASARHRRASEPEQFKSLLEGLGRSSTRPAAMRSPRGGKTPKSSRRHGGAGPIATRRDSTPVSACSSR